LDVHLGRSSQATAEAVLYQRQRQLDGVLRQLEILLGRYPAGATELATELPAVPPPVPAGLPANLVARRPDLVAAERRLAAADARLVVARKALYPRISLTASGGQSSSALGDLLDGDFSVWNLVGNISQPLFQGGRLRGGVDLAQAGTEQALAQYADSVLRAYAEVESALAAAQLLAQQEAAVATAARAAGAARRLAAERYSKGLADLITVLEAQRRAFEAESQLLAVRRQRLQARLDLHLALGGGWSDKMITEVSRAE
jgi:NodT family efflux transporter outer membrane factor (OMF) lipoprotein